MTGLLVKKCSKNDADVLWLRRYFLFKWITKKEEKRIYKRRSRLIEYQEVNEMTKTGMKEIIKN